ncbi:hotdog family protein, partial [Singulisphaera rosea]
AEADIRPSDWFMTCHFVDDRVMPGTLMFECCLHTLRIFLMRMGWIGEHDEVSCDPVPGIASRLKCRGQVIESTKVVTYEVSIKELGYRPEPQYHHALYRAPAAEQESAWVAVPGYFPTEREYCSKAYIQLTRSLLRQRDLNRLAALAAELARWKDDKAHGEELAVIARAGVDALDGNIDGIPQTFGKDVSDPALQELAIEVVAQAIDSAKTMNTTYALRDLQPLLRQLILRLDRGNVTDELRAKQILRGVK